jgi:integrase/recombinase XerD
MVRVQRIIVPDTQERCWVLFNSNQPLIAPNQYLSYLHHLGRSPNTVRAYAHHLQAFSKFLCEENRDWTTLSLTELAKFVAWLRRVSSSNGKARSDTTINTILAAVGSFYEYQDRLGVETNISRSRRFGAKSPYKPFLHHISRNRHLRRAVMQVRAIRRMPRVFSAQEVQALLNACARQRDRLLVSLLYESGMRVGQVLGLRHADIRSYDGEIDIIPRANSNGALAKSRSPYTVHVSKELMEL